METLSSTVVWSDHGAFLANGLSSLLAAGTHSDLTIKCHDREFAVHKLVLGLFTEHFADCDGIWIRINVDPSHMQKIIEFMYLGRAVVAHDELEGFLQSCKAINMRLFSDASTTKSEKSEGDACYELNNFQLMCRNCYKVYADEKGLRKHTWGCTRPATLQCRYCDKKFRFRNDVRNHERFHTGEKPFQCDKCDRAFTLKCTLVDHVRAKHELVKFKCKECGHVLGSRMGLKTHVAAKHATVKPFICGECGQCFALQSLLTVHVNQKHKGRARKKKVNGSPWRALEKFKGEPGAQTSQVINVFEEQPASSLEDREANAINIVECEIEETELVLIS